MTLLSVSDLSVSIRDTKILDRISLTVAAGEIVAVTGESGSGKSMTALAIMGLLPGGADCDGLVNLDSVDLLGLSEKEMCGVRGNDIGMVFQEPMTALNPVKTIGDQVAETILVHQNTSRAEALQRARETLDRVGLPARDFPLSRYPHELSGGQRQRVVIAMAIALRPKLLIADEPTTALDVTTQANILALLQELVRDFDMGLLMITHDLAVVADVADQIVVMRRGEIVERGPSPDLFQTMQHPYTRMLFEASRHRADLPDRANTEDQPLLRVDHVSRDYALPRTGLFGTQKTFRAVNDVSFSIPAGGRVGLVGESGCGKSTLTRAILGLEAVQEGQILLDGDPVTAQGAPDLNVRRKIQVVFQDPYSSFNPRHKVGRSVSEPFHLLREALNTADRQAAVAKALVDVGLKPEDAEKYIHEFSGGQRQRIAIARALIIRPKLIVFDEAVSALDVSVRAQILDLLAALSDDYALSYLFISHDLSVVRSITDQVLVMQSGKIVEYGETEAVFNAPQNAYTRSLIDAAPTLPIVDPGTQEEMRDGI